MDLKRIEQIAQEEMAGFIFDLSVRRRYPKEVMSAGSNFLGTGEIDLTLALYSPEYPAACCGELHFLSNEQVPPTYPKFCVTH
jgi:hypothetical protein